MRRIKGFTLTELLVVIALIALFTLLALASWNYITESNTESSAKNTINAFLGQARQEAISQQRLAGALFYHDEGGIFHIVQVMYDPNDPSQEILDTVEHPNILQLGTSLGIHSFYFPNENSPAMMEDAPVLILFEGNGHLRRSKKWRIDLTVNNNLSKLFQANLSGQSREGIVTYLKSQYPNGTVAEMQQNHLDGKGTVYFVNKYNGALLEGTR